MIQKSLLNHFGLEKLGFYQSPVIQEFRDDIVQGIMNNQMIIIPGEIGAGKSSLVNQAAAQTDDITKFVYVRNYYKENCTISSIINAVIYDLPGHKESPRRDLEARSRQFIRLVGETVVNQKFNVCIIIEEAHRLHTNTFRAIKELREAVYLKKSPLFSVVLTGFPELAAKIEKRKEVLWRAQIIELNENNGWMKFEERVKFIKTLFKNAVTQSAAVSIAQICKEPLHIINYIEKKMKQAKKAGYRELNSEVIQPSAKELIQGYDITYGQLAKESGLPRSTVFDAVNNENHPKKKNILEAISRLSAGTGQMPLTKAG